MLNINSIVLQNIWIFFNGVIDILYSFRSIDHLGLVEEVRRIFLTPWFFIGIRNVPKKNNIISETKID